MVNFFKKNLSLFVLAGIFCGLFCSETGLILRPWLLLIIGFMMYLGLLDFNWIRPPGWQRTGLLLLIIHFVIPLIVLPFSSLIDDRLYLGLVLVGCMSIGIGSIYFIQHYGGEVAHGIFFVSLTNLISPILVPIILYIFAGSRVELPFLDILTKMSTFVLLPLALVILTPAFVKNPIRKAKVFLGPLIMFLVIFGVVSPVAPILFANPLRALFLSLTGILLILLSGLAGYLMAQTAKEKLTFPLLTGFKNFTMASVIALEEFGEVVAVFPVLYALLSNSMIIPYELWAKKFSQALGLKNS